MIKKQIKLLLEELISNKTVYGDDYNKWVAIHVSDSNEPDYFAYSTKNNGTIMYGDDLMNGTGYFVSYFDTPYFLEDEAVNTMYFDDLESVRKYAEKMLLKIS